MPSSGILSILAITSVGEFSIHLMLEHFRRIVRDSTWWQSAKIHSCTNSNGPSRSRHVRFQIFLMHASGGAGTKDLSEAEQQKVLKCVAAAKQKGIDVEKELLIVDASAGPTINNWCTNRVPCITRARAAAKGFYIVNLGRFTTLKELAMLQGWEFDRLNVPNIGKTWKGAAIGNGMTKPVLKAVLRRAVWSAGLVKSKPKRR